PSCIDRSTDANRTKSRRLAVLNGCSSKNGTTVANRSALRFTEKRRSGSLWLSERLFSMRYPHPNSSRRSSSTDLDEAAWVTEHSCWTCQPSRHTSFRTTEIEKQPSPSTKPTIHCSIPGLSC